ncbi:MAG: response regulator [Gemmatimonadaceae bacterium]
MSKILLVEDNRAFAEMLASNLEHEGFEVVAAATGVDGLKQAKSGNVDLIILDLMLPTMSGFTVLQRLRRTCEGIAQANRRGRARNEIKISFAGFGDRFFCTHCDA